MYALFNGRLKLVVMVAQYYVIHNMLVVTVVVLAFHWVRDVRETLEILVKFTIPAITPWLTSSRGEYRRVVGIHSDG